MVIKKVLNNNLLLVEERARSRLPWGGDFDFPIKWGTR